MGRFKNFINGNVFVDARVYVLVNIMWIVMYLGMNHGWSKICNKINDNWYETCMKNVNELKRVWGMIKEYVADSDLEQKDREVIRKLIEETDMKIAGL